MQDYEDLDQREHTLGASDVLNFWFYELGPKDWFSKNSRLDQLIAERFGALYTAALHGELASWRQSAEGRLAEIIVLDQFSRNLYRESAQAFAADSMALALAQEAVCAKLDQQLTVQQRAFLYMPYMHSESLLIHQQAVKLFSQRGLEESLDFEIQHKAIIERFGRYPHRNKALGRKSTKAEREFLQLPGSAF
ncbi:DUF924 family protein [Aliidiomarina maris]|uniref:DUF924 domain-containing protein n=1 Tax=Aliidiomarina maris TaxID=531312 RepID=A0A327WUH4_9GAMM|nr:DUF924 family protein [Aliidiomarina maris]MCL5050271.1 DUF924 domain-containing protein [Bacillota bacterium]RAJ95351.1 uncharacterized protein (DUF924 family) [Aliidiomarina maris]RUO22757.1 DUF924 domain-containing protein [Aliidiomarina maris]